MSRKPLPLLLLLALAACEGEPSRHGGEPLGELPAPPSHLLDPAQVAAGDRLGGFMVRQLEARPSTLEPGGWVGSAELAGEVAIAGTYGEHPAYPEPEALCFFPDEVSAQRLPRFPNDQRHAWFCFSNDQEAFAALQPPPGRGTATVVIDELHYRYDHGEEHNTARLVRVEDHAPSLPAPADPR
jgi:hypothetical protein